MTDKLSKSEIRKDAIQDAVDATASTVGEIATIVVSAVRDVVRSMGGLASDLYEIRDASRRAERDQGLDQAD
ncbi:hypothetical protein [Nocardioides sp.]|uniref:hypothetical protein n=1 Tax=Nocardioides sp. TaxID=35761 RepID=UPI0039E619B6